MTLLERSLCGSRTPTLARVPAGKLDYSVADAVIEWVDRIGMTLFDWQRDVLRQSLALRGDKWAAYEVDLIVPRQNGKNEILIALELAAVAVLGKRHVVHSAHEAITAQRHFNRFQELAEQLPEVAKLLPATASQGFYTSNGKEHIRFRNGAVIDFRTRTKQAGRGFSSDLVVLDEAFNLPPKAVGSLMYTLRARRNPQIWKTSSAAHENSVVLHSDRSRAVESSDDDTRLFYVEWGNESDCDPAEEATWLRSNPSVGSVAPGFALELQTFHNEWAAARGDPQLRAEFVREVCGVPDEPIGANAQALIPHWALLADPDSVIVSNQSWAIAVSPIDQGPQWAAIGKAGRTADGRLHVEFVDHRAGTSWVVPRCVELFGLKPIPLRVHKTGPEGALIKSLREAGVEVLEVSTTDVTQATGDLIGLANADPPGLVHTGLQPSLDKSIRGAVLRSSSDGAAVWSQRSSSVEISPLVAVTVAAGGVATAGDGWIFE